MRRPVPIRSRIEYDRRQVDVVVPEGNGPISLPDIHVKTLASVSMIGKPAPRSR